MNNTNKIANQIINEYQADSRKRNQAIKSSIKTFTINTILAVGTCLAYLVIHKFIKPCDFADVLICGIVWNISGTFICLIMLSGGVGRYCNSVGIRKYPPICVLLNMLSLVDTFVIFTWCLVAFKYSPYTDSLEMSFDKLLIVSPVIFVIVLLITLLKGHRIIIVPYANNNLYNNELRSYGINPNMIPYDTKMEYYQQLGQDEWQEIGLAIKQFGYDIFGG